MACDAEWYGALVAELRLMVRQEHQRLQDNWAFKLEEAQGAALESVIATIQGLFTAHERQARPRWAPPIERFDSGGVDAAAERVADPKDIVVGKLHASGSLPEFGAYACEHSSPTRGLPLSSRSQASVQASRVQLPPQALRGRAICIKDDDDGEQSAPYESPAQGSPLRIDTRPSRGSLSENRSEATQDNEKKQWRRHVRGQVTRRLDNINSGSFLVRTISGLLGNTPYANKLPRPVTQQSLQETPKQEMSRLEQVVDSSLFNSLCGLMIVVTAVFIGHQTDTCMRNALSVPQGQEPDWFAPVAHSLLALFVVEVFLRGLAKRWGYFFGVDWKWNLFDLLLATYSVAEVFIAHFEEEGGFSLTYTRLIRGFRMVRVLRVIRVLRFFRELRLMVCSMMQSIVSLSWALVLMLIIIYLFAIIFMHAGYIYLQEVDVARISKEQEDVREGLATWYGSLPTGMFALLMAVSGGDDWVNFVAPLTAISPAYQILFCIYVFFVLIGMVNVVTGAFVQRACELSKIDRDLVIQGEMVAHESFIAEMKGIFEEVDQDGEGKITWDKFRKFMENDHVQAYFATQQLDTSDARELFTLLDTDGNGSVGLEEFVMGCQRLRGQAKSSDVAALQREQQRSSRKFCRSMKRLDEQLWAICNAMNLVGDGWRSPGSCRARPGSAGAGNGSCDSYSCTPASKRSPNRLGRGAAVRSMSKGL